MDNSKQQLILNQQQLLQQRQHRQEIQEQFTKDIARYKELTSPQPGG